MAKLKYEIQIQTFPGLHFESEICTLTGLELDDVRPLTMKVTSWSGQTYVKLFRQLGYNCNPRFIKFDKETPWPCLMRAKKRGCKKYWYGFVYHQGEIYLTDEHRVISWADWNAEFPQYRITSMLQVWI